MEDKIPEWSEEDYRGMALVEASMLKTDPDSIVSNGVLAVPGTWLNREIKFLSDINDKGEYSAWTPPLSGYLLKAMEDIKTILHLQNSSDTLLYINHESPDVRAIASWRLENGR